MNRNAIEQIGSQGRVVGTFYPDTDEIQWRRNNANRDANNVYRGAADAKAFSILPNELVLGRRKTESMQYELGLTGLSGLPMKGADGNVRDLYFIGVSLATDENRDGGVAVVKSGTASVINNGSKDIHAGDLVAWRKPRVSEISHTHGSSTQKVLPIIEPFDAGNVSAPREAMLASMSSTDPEFGIRDKPADANVGAMSPLQEEAFGMKFGEMGKIAAVLRWLGDKDDKGAALINNPDEVLDLDAAETLRAIYFTDEVSTEAYDQAEKARDQAAMVRRSTVIGTALNTATANGGTLDVMLRLA